MHVCHSAHVTKDSFSEVVFPPGFRQGLSVSTELGTPGLPAFELPGDFPSLPPIALQVCWDYRCGIATSGLLSFNLYWGGHTHSVRVEDNLWKLVL